MKALTVSNELCLGILMFCIVLINGCAPYSQPAIAGTLEPILPSSEEIFESHNSSFALSLEKTYLGSIQPEGVVHPSFTAISPDGHKVAYAASRGNNKWYIMIEDLKTQQFIKKPEFDSVSAPTLSPDGSKVAYTAMQNGKWFIMINNKKGPEFDNVSYPVLSPDGSRVAYVAVQNGKYFVMIDDKKEPEFDSVYTDIVFSPDGRKIAYGVKNARKAFVIVDDKKGPEFDEVTNPIFSPQGDKVAYFAKLGSKVFVMVNNKKGPEHVSARRDLTFSSDGRKLAYVADTTTQGNNTESLVIILALDNRDNLTLDKTFGPLNVSVTRAQPLTLATLSGIGWSPTFNVEGTKIAYGVNGGPSAAIKEPIRPMPPDKYYFIENSIGNSTIEVDGNVVATISNTGLVTPLSFSPDGKELSWMVLTKDRKLYLKELKLK